MMQYQKDLFEAFELNGKDNGIDIRLPTSVQEMKEFITKGRDSIMKNFPVQEVFEIADHACVSLIETFHIMAGHGADYCFPLDGEARNREGLNGQKAMDDLIDEVKEAMKEANVEEHIRVKTKIGWALF